MTSRSGAVAAISVAVAACALPPQGTTPSLTVDGAELVLTTNDGRVLRSPQLVGSTLAIGGREVRLIGVERDSLSRDVLWHRFVVSSPDAGDVVPLCEVDASGGRLAMPLLDEHGHVQFVCSSGAIVKCIRWGYRPSRPAAPGSARQVLHDACVRMVRADYGGDGRTATRDGTRIQFCDRLGVNPCSGERGALEAAWSPGGASCVARPRVPALATLATLAHSYPRLVGHLGPEACTMATAARDERAVLFSLVP